ncbi:LuxR C-terminal-related transcriptional regulator [Pseudonocardia sp. H11422]|uniref:LuxR C-terminal-related transcriptional regulator n=1 Tax=Pseudonocardia sp. H11422 TaxID=2835866 RepID=UPI001BDCF348|nr:LuxR C-terminal-related transcriptional regulator [Pseudonocardia sp. H11422]
MDLPDGRLRQRPAHVTATPVVAGVRLLAFRLTNREIGTRLHISETTAKFHVSGVMRKFGVRKRTEIVHQATLLGLA